MIEKVKDRNTSNEGINDSSNNLILFFPSIQFFFHPLHFLLQQLVLVFPRSANFPVSREKEKKKSGGGGKNTRSIFNSTKWPKVAGANSANSKRSSAFVIWIRGNRKRWRAKLISNRVWKSIEGDTLVRPSRQSNSVSLFCFDLVLEPFCSTNLESRSLKKNRNSRNECFFDNYSLDLFKVTVRNWKEKKLWGNSRILLILNWKKDIRIIIVSSLDKFYLFQKESFSKMYRIYIDTFVENIFVENIFGKIERKQKLILKNKTRLIKFIR